MQDAREWHDLDYLIDFFTCHRNYINTDFWINAGLDPDDPERSALRVIEEADNLENYIEQLVTNCEDGVKPDFDEYFHFLGGKYTCLWSLEPVKSYGTLSPISFKALCYKDWRELLFDSVWRH